MLDQYKEDGTAISTYHSSLLSGLVRIGEEDDTTKSKSASLQISAHQNSSSKELTDLTIGIPLITGDVADAAPEKK